jgi:proton-translocating NADH-quinone oxidoreductase chain N
MPDPKLLTPPGSNDLLLVLPEIILMLAGCFLLAWEMARPRDSVGAGRWAVFFHIAALGAMAAPYRLYQGPFFAPVEGAATIFHGNMVVDGFALSMRVVLLVGSLLSTLVGLRYADRFKNPGEFFAMLLFATSAAALLTGAADLLMIYLAVEFLSLTSYILAGYLKFQPRSTEAALKYFLYGAITAAVMLYGLSFLYGLGGTTNLYAVAGEVTRVPLGQSLAQVVTQPAGIGVLMVALVLSAVGFGFKTGMAPFHQWVPDVYDGSPLPVMAWLSVVSKTAGIAVFVRVLMVAFPHNLWFEPVAYLAAITMTVGNLAALGQTNIKRMLAYSSIAHAGYTLMAVAALGLGVWQAPAVTTGSGLQTVGITGASTWQTTGVAVYLATYVFMNLGALAVVMAVYNKIKSHQIDDYAGLVARAPGLAWLMLFFLLSLAGIPPTAGFWGKFVLFAATLEAGPQLLWLAICGFINSVISVYYYWNVVRAMFILKPKSEEDLGATPELRLTIAVAAIATFAIFVLAGPFMHLFGAP